MDVRLPPPGQSGCDQNRKHHHVSDGNREKGQGAQVAVSNVVPEGHDRDRRAGYDHRARQRHANCSQATVKIGPPTRYQHGLQEEQRSP